MRSNPPDGTIRPGATTPPENGFDALGKVCIWPTPCIQAVDGSSNAPPSKAQRMAFRDRFILETSKHTSLKAVVYSEDAGRTRLKLGEHPCHLN
jgi:hypothetical protein